MFEKISLSVDVPKKMVLKHPATGLALVDKDGNEAYLELLSSNSAKGKAFETAMLNARFENREVKLTAEQLEAQRVDQLVALTTGWYLVGFDGEPMGVAFTPDNVKKFYTTPGCAGWKEKATAFVEQDKNFI